MPRLNDDIFKINWPAFESDKLPIPLRIPFWIQWCLSLTKPIQTLHNTFLAFRTEILDKTTVNGQRKILETYLRRKVGAGINIILNNRFYYILRFPDNDSRSASIIKFENDGAGDIVDHPKYPDRIMSELEEFDFTVQIPSTFSVADQLKVKALVDAYKTYTTTYNIELI